MIDQTLTRFVDEACSVGDDYQTSSTKLFVAYQAWCDRAGIGLVYRASHTTFGTRMPRLGYMKRRVPGGVIYLGLAPR